MKKKDKQYYILSELWNNGHITVGALLQTCQERGITADQKELEELLQEMADKKLIVRNSGSVKPLITRNEYESKGLAKYAQTFINGGSQDKAVYNPPSTTFTPK